MGVRERVFARRPQRQPSQAEEILNTIIKIVLLLAVVFVLIAIGMHYF
jgi:hypothetical protein